MSNVAAPVSIETLEPGVLRFVWDEAGTLTTDFPTRYLRLHCRCAACVSETTGANLIDRVSVPDDVTVTDASLVGNYAVALDFSDGHTTGIFSWEYIVELVEDDDLRANIRGQ